MIKLIIFDMTGVCYTNEDPVFLSRFAQRHNIPFEELERLHDSLVPTSETGEKTGEAVWQEILDRYGIEGEPGDIIRELISCKEEKPGTISLIKKLEVKKAYLTNYNEAYWKEFGKRFDTSYFDDGIVSYQIGARKPSKKGFAEMLARFNVRPEETVFTDDRKENLRDAEEMGIHTVHFQDEEHLAEELRRLGVDI